MNLSDILDACAESVVAVDGCTKREAYGKLATTCLRLGGYSVAFVDEDAIADRMVDRKTAPADCTCGFGGQHDDGNRRCQAHPDYWTAVGGSS